MGVVATIVTTTPEEQAAISPQTTEASATASPSPGPGPSPIRVGGKPSEVSTGEEHGEAKGSPEKERIKSAVQDALTRLTRDALAKTALGGTEEPPSSERSPPPPESGSVPAPPPGPQFGIQVVLNGEPVPLERPPITQQGKLLVPLKDVASALGDSVISLGGGKIQIVSSDGQMRQFTLSSSDPGLLINEDELREHLELRTRYDETQKTLFLETATAMAPLRTYTVPKSEEQLQAEAAAQRLTEQAEQPLQVEAAAGEPGYVPESARPAIDITGTITYSHDHLHAEEPFRNLTTLGRGRVLDYDVAFESVRKDIHGELQHDYTYLNLRKPDLFVGLFDQRSDLFPLRSQFEEFHGVKVRKVWGEPSAVPLGPLTRNPYRPLESFRTDRSATTLSWGQTDTFTSGSSGSVKYLGQLTEARQELIPTDWLWLQSGLFYLENEADLPERSGTSALPRNNLVSFGQAVLALPNHWALSGQVAHAQYNPDNDPDTAVGDWDWRAALDADKERYRMRFAYELVGDEYASLGDPAIYRDYQGASWFGTYRLTNAWSVSSSLLRYRNNVDRSDEATTSDNQVVSLSTAYQLTSDQSLNLNFGQSVANPSGPAAGSSNRGVSYGVDYFLPFLFDTRLLTSYQYYRNNAPAGSDSVSHGAGVTLFRSFGRGSSWDVSERLRRTMREFEEDDSSLDTTFDINYQITPKLNSSMNASYGRTLTDSAETRNTLSGGLGVDYEVLTGTRVGARYNVNSYSLDTERGRWPREWSVLFLFSKDFGFSTPPAFGRIEGLVFHDLNNNGLSDAGEPGVEDAIARLGEGKKVASNAQGWFAFSRVAPGLAEVHLDLSDLPASWMVMQPHQQVTVTRYHTARLSFPLVQAASLRGTVFIDGNGDGVFQPQEEPLEHVAVILSPSDDFRKTNPDGEFQFEPLSPGGYLLSIYEEDLPKGYELVSKTPLVVTLVAGEEASKADFAVRLIPGPGQDH